MKKGTGKNVYQIVTDRILAELEKGTIPWERPWSGLARPRNWKTGREYHGINLFLLPPGEYATFNQIKEAGGTVKKGEHAHIAVFWKFITIQDEYKDPISGNMVEYKKEVPFLRYYNVFNIETQAEGIQSKIQPVRCHDPFPECERIVSGYLEDNGPTLRHGGSFAYYDASRDTISIPKAEMFKTADHYYTTLFHEMVHSTGHESRLNREFGTMFGNERYSREELIAEMGAAFLSAHAGIDNNSVNDNIAAYIAGWKKALQNDPRAVVVAAGKAQKAVQFILKEKEGDTETENITEPETITV